MSEQKVVYRCEDIDRLREQLKIGDPVRTEVWFDRLGERLMIPRQRVRKIVGIYPHLVELESWPGAADNAQLNRIFRSSADSFLHRSFIARSVSASIPYCDIVLYLILTTRHHLRPCPGSSSKPDRHSPCCHPRSCENGSCFV